MPKMKSKKALTKRIKVTGTGKIKRGSAYMSHLAPNKTTKQKRHLRKGGFISASDYKRIKYLIQN
ncbi:MAG TPA: 50S ribosomal protein L35 [Bacilli bacterium]|nr:50S ribosomal protein L35 [Bacilli bacterium]